MRCEDHRWEKDGNLLGIVDGGWAMMMRRIEDEDGDVDGGMSD